MTTAFHRKRLWTMGKCACNAFCFLPAPRDHLFRLSERTVHESKGPCSFQLSDFNDKYMFLIFVLFEVKFKGTELATHIYYYQFFFFISFLYSVPLYYLLHKSCFNA